jgi:hypothetical protein
MSMLPSQELFDEMLVESQELFEYSNEQAVQETISELTSSSSSGNSNNEQSVRLDHLSLTHPDSDEGIQERKLQAEFCAAVQANDIPKATQLLLTENKRKFLLVAQGLLLQKELLTIDCELINFAKNGQELSLLLDFYLALIPDVVTTHPLTREIKLKLAKPLEESWCQLYEQQTEYRIELLNWARVVCNCCEPNKKSLMQAAIRYKGSDPTLFGLNLIIQTLPLDLSDTSKKEMAKNISLLLTILCKFQAGSEPVPKDGEEPTVSSAHANVLELHKCGTVSALHRLAKVAEEEELQGIFLGALRVLAIDNDVVQNMVAVGILETVSTGMESSDQVSSDLAAASLGLLRNLCANDEVKTSVCKKSLGSILHIMQTHSSHASVQENGCGILAAMSLRNPQNAVSILDADGANFILKAMRTFPNKVSLQRQGCLALRNMAVRLTDPQKQVLLDAGTENVLKDISSKHQGSIEEAVSALYLCLITMCHRHI